MWGAVNFSNQGWTILFLESTISLITVTFFFLSLTSASFLLSCFMFFHPSLLYSMIKPTRGISPFQNIFFSMNPTFLRLPLLVSQTFQDFFFRLITKSQLDHRIVLSISGHRRVLSENETSLMISLFPILYSKVGLCKSQVCISSLTCK